MHRPAGFGFRDRAGGHRPRGGLGQRRHAVGSGLGLEGGGIRFGGDEAALRFRHHQKLGQRQPPRRASAAAGGAAGRAPCSVRRLPLARIAQAPRQPLRQAALLWTIIRSPSGADTASTPSASPGTDRMNNPLNARTWSIARGSGPRSFGRCSIQGPVPRFPIRRNGAPGFSRRSSPPASAGST